MGHLSSLDLLFLVLERGGGPATPGAGGLGLATLPPGPLTHPTLFVPGAGPGAWPACAQRQSWERPASPLPAKQEPGTLTPACEACRTQGQRLQDLPKVTWLLPGAPAWPVGAGRTRSPWWGPARAAQPHLVGLAQPAQPAGTPRAPAPHSCASFRLERDWCGVRLGDLNVQEDGLLFNCFFILLASPLSSRVSVCTAGPGRQALSLGAARGRCFLCLALGWPWPLHSRPIHRPGGAFGRLSSVRVF